MKSKFNSSSNLIKDIIHSPLEIKECNSNHENTSHLNNRLEFSPNKIQKYNDQNSKIINNLIKRHNSSLNVLENLKKSKNHRERTKSSLDVYANIKKSNLEIENLNEEEKKHIKSSKIIEDSNILVNNFLQNPNKKKNSFKIEKLIKHFRKSFRKHDISIHENLPFKKNYSNKNVPQTLNFFLNHEEKKEKYSSPQIFNLIKIDKNNYIEKKSNHSIESFKNDFTNEKVNFINSDILVNKVFENKEIINKSDNNYEHKDNKSLRMNENFLHNFDDNKNIYKITSFSEKMKEPSNSICDDKRFFYKFKNVYDSLSDDDIEDAIKTTNEYSISINGKIICCEGNTNINRYFLYFKHFL